MKGKILGIVIVLMSAFIFKGGSLSVKGDLLDEKSYLEHQSDAIELYGNLLKTYETADGKYDYPDYYGGSFLNGTGDLTIQLVNPTEEIKKKYIELAGEKPVYFTEVSYSRNELKEAYDDIAEVVLEHYELFHESVYGINQLYTDEYRNRVVVYTNSCEEEDILAICALTDFSYVLELKYGGEVMPTSTTVKPGECIVVNDGSYSAGFRCRYIPSGGSTYAYGLITAGHENAFNEVAYRGSSQIGSVYTRQFSGYVDASLIALNSSTTVSNVTSLGGVTVTGSYTTSIPALTLVYKEGYASQEVKSGYVIAYDAICIYGGSVVTNMVLASYYSTQGDSGGIVYTNVNSSYVIVGITVANLNANNSISYACQAQYIVSAFGIVPY